MIAFPPFLIYIIGALILPLLPARVRHEWMLFLSIIGLASISLLDQQVNGWLLPFIPGTELILLSVDNLSQVVGYIFAGISVLAIIYASYEGRLGHQIAILFQIGAGIGIVFAGDFITLFIFWELLALSSLALIWYGGAEARGPGYRYALMHILGGVFLLAAISMQYAETGSLLVDLAAPGITTILFIIGVGFNAGMIPIHAWLPDSYPKATITGSVFLCVFTTKGAIYLMARTLPGSEVMMYLGGIMVVFGLVFAILQDDMRKLLSYHVISQVGYMVAAMGIGTSLAVNGGIAHLFNHILYKALLFMVVGAIIYQTGKNRLSELGGLGRQMPITFAACLIASAAISGVPGLNGYISKEMIVAAAAESGLFTLEVLLLIGSVGTFLSFIKLNYYAFIKEKPGIVTTDPPTPMLIAMVMAAAACLIYGVYPWILFSILPYPVTHDVFAPVHIIEMFIIFAAVLLNLWVVRSMIRKPKYIPPDLMELYRAGGSRIIRFSSVTLPAVSQGIGNMIEHLGAGVSWFLKNPVMAGEILTRTVMIRTAGGVMGASVQESQRRALTTLTNSYPDTGGTLNRAPGYGIFFIGIVIFAYFLMVFII
ncbi:multicomponent Na+:H+ antiporter subunit D [Methanocalculus alkaliphilus]|uniref:Na(+)/H(+) antiporter subunit D n=1 Tax=Methanocalculus alkaliphilus TaxID=768730 RepID=UPI00209D3042|nr:Na(+)/H(+) antiporter subunit D [Methanocalculus alkaliphilus]MCP1714390.1 multicomponent Na+:H+ antiporter subunit D [Methanocalculus alkaliphilus]